MGRTVRPLVLEVPWPPCVIFLRHMAVAVVASGVRAQSGETAVDCHWGGRRGSTAV